MKFAKYYISYLLIGIVMGIYSPLISLYLKEYLFFSGNEIGIILASLSIFSIIALPIWGIIADLTKSPKKAWLASILLSSIGFIFFGVVQNFILFLIVSIIFSIVRAPLFPLYDDILLYLEKKYNLHYGTVRAFCSVGFAVAAFIGFYISSVLGEESIFYICSVLFLIVFLIGLTMEDTEYHQKEKVNIFEDLPKLFVNIKFVIACLFMIIIFGVLNTNMNYVSMYMDMKNFSDNQISTVILLSALIELPILFSTRYIYRYLKISGIIFISIVLHIIKFGLMYFFNDINVLYILAPIHGITFGLSFPIILQYVEKNVPKRILASAFSILSAAVALGIAVISYLSGVVLDYFDTVESLFFFFMITSMVALPLIPLFKKYDYKAN